MSVDLHIHTTASDGRLSPVEIVEQAIQVGLSHIAITDHDTVDGLISLHNSGHLFSNDITIISGIEFSTDLPHNEVHILGYNIDIFNSELLEQLHIIVDDRWNRIKRIVTRLDQLGYSIDYNRVVELAGTTTSVGRPHIAKALVEKCYFSNVTEVFDTLLYKNGPAFVPHFKLQYSEIIQLIKRTGGIPVLAHPGLVGNDKIVLDIINAGISGLEVYHPKHDNTQTHKYRDIAERHNLIITGGSDFHAIPSRFPEKLGVYTIPASFVKNLLYSV